MDLSLKPLRCFAAVAELRSFTRAAERVNLTQPSLSTQINQLERYLGFRLFERSTRQVTLTGPGMAFLANAKRLIQESDRLLNAAMEIRGDLSNQLRLGAALYTFDIGERRDLIEAFMDAYPDVALRVNAHDQIDILNALIEHKLDIALVIGLGISDADHENGDGAELTFPLGFKRMTLRRERIGLRVPVTSPLAQFDEIPPEALAGQRVVIPSEEHGRRVVGPIVALLETHGAEPVLPPEATATAIERHGRKHGLPAVTFGWFAQGDTAQTVRRNIQGFDVSTELVILSRRADEEGAAARFLNFAERYRRAQGDCAPAPST